MKKLLDALLLIICCSSQSHSQVTVTPVSLRQLNFVEPKNQFQTHIVDFNYIYNNPTTTFSYLNVYVINFANSQTTWAVQNMALEPFPNPRDLHYQMSFFDIFTFPAPINNIGIKTYITDTIFTVPLVLGPSAFVPMTVAPFFFDFGAFGGLDNSLIPAINQFTTAPGNTFDKTDTSKSITRSCNVPNIPLDSSKHKGDTAYAGDWNACAPAGCANSMEWLESVYPTKISSGLTHRQKLEELSKMMNRLKEKGAKADDIVKAKLEFVDKYKLPIRVKFQHNWITDTSIASPNSTHGHNAKNHNKDQAHPGKNQIDWDWLWGEVDHGEDVELWLTYESPTGTRHGCHLVALTGINVTKGVRRISYKDDARQGDSTGTAERTFTVDSVSNGYLYLKEDDVRNPAGAVTSRTYIEGVYSESYDSTITFVSVRYLHKNTKLDLKVYNNPFSNGQQATIEFYATSNEELRIEVYDLYGKLMTSLKGNTSEFNTYTWNGTDVNGTELPPGLYLVKITAGENSAQVKLTKW